MCLRGFVGILLVGKVGIKCPPLHVWLVLDLCMYKKKLGPPCICTD